MKLDLEPNEKKLYDKISNLVNEIRIGFKKYESNDDLNKKITKASEYAHELHMQLKKRGHEPKHHNYMIINREMNITDPKFYNHFHPLEDLLKFISDTTANDDPQDITVGKEFDFKVCSPRLEYDDSYTFIRTEDGWKIEFMGIGGLCDIGGHPYLFENLEHDGISYPSDLDVYIEFLWLAAKNKGLTKEQVQEALTQLADWVKTVGKNAPKTNIWKGV